MPLLFSYGTLQQEAVQVSTFGRLLKGQPDALVGFEQSLLTIEDPEFVSVSGKAEHSIVKFNGRHDSRVNGTVFEVSDLELAKAFERVAADLPAATPGISGHAADAFKILVALGLSQGDARRRVEAAASELGETAPAQELVRHCLAT